MNMILIILDIIPNSTPKVIDSISNICNIGMDANRPLRTQSSYDFSTIHSCIVWRNRLEKDLRILDHKVHSFGNHLSRRSFSSLLPKEFQARSRLNGSWLKILHPSRESEFMQTRRKLAYGKRSWSFYWAIRFLPSFGV